MEKIKYKKKHKYSHFCFCLGLRPGVIISSVLWMIEGVILSTLFITSSMKNYKKNKDDIGEVVTSLYYYVAILTKTLSVYFIILFLISIIGLASLLIYKSTPLLRVYSYTSWFFAVFIYFVLAIVSIVAIMVSKNGFIGYCNEVGNNNINYCVNEVMSQSIWLYLIIFFQGSIHVYFSIILQTYVERCEQLEKKKRREASSKRNNLLSSSGTSNVFKIKVDKTYDDRVVDS
ncbi:uncharacterized protein OCT59_004308 [Rhizophagus irregularis]|uniref:Transmembrane protein n=4 Tax=Rhizophagus irregularis TaxID=588596 RepID=A0A015NG27_RHIIW|nr:hypothetical protein GLOIN_2v1721672 [Rhizophagus irregularis DAOM 181602=DAOM 197198]EXX78323.1 hypothetical protein RirG_016020 [Rhizophagus irregularis DAOM 197198w]POG59487.1 hypothetical protein GLOIN_2v1721672 [Rhizophagus irregularis DAOM 181602=DAOM 197198]UZO12791.1 hypothetical protein OCT59_004308 [Rhizophagus irregularis]CAB5204674.1 unnamed protein product [Rhizophagus irregularis]|eukprot:XP_025166353.1 hypothetical protein GLOIN_2v1721672 [Rhizophagus irregularis DAOM 181602=DAOM 197198]